MKPVAPLNRKNILSLYRATLREAGKLPHPYLCFFHRLRTHDYFHRNKYAKEPAKKIARAKQDLRRLQGANRGEKKPLENLLRNAYGRTGKLRKELLEPHLTDRNRSPEELIIPGDRRMKFPVYPPSLTALLGSSIATSTGVSYTPSQLEHPPILPVRANPESSDAKLLGPIPIRRLINARWRFYSDQLEKTLPPLEVDASAYARSSDESNAKHIPSSSLENTGLLDEVIRMATAKQVQPLPKRYKPTPEETSLSTPEIPSTRFLRRRYRELLGSIPKLEVKAPKKSDSNENPVYTVSPVSDVALVYGGLRPRVATATEQDWINKAAKLKQDRQ